MATYAGRDARQIKYRGRSLTVPERIGEKARPIVIWAVSIGLFSPYTLAVYLGDIKLTLGKLVTTVLVLPAIANLLAGVAMRRRRLIMADALAILVATWMVVAPISVVGNGVFVSAASQSLEFFGSYMIGRAFFFGGGPLALFGRALAVVVAAVFALAVLDVVSHRFLVAETLTAIFHPPGGALDGADPHFHRWVFGFDLLRATSTFDHPILLGSFCALSAAILAYMPLTGAWRIGSLGLCGFGCILALSSAPILALMIVGVVTVYDALLKRARWRWTALAACGTTALGALFALSDNPMTWLIRHLTFDPSTGYFRLLMWDAALEYIGSHGWVGNGFQPMGIFLLDNSVDSLWVGKALNYGVPTVALLFLLGMTTILPARGQKAFRSRYVEIDRLCIGFTLVIVMFDVIGLTVYFWNGIWLFYALCLGIRGSLKECCLIRPPRPLDRRSIEAIRGRPVFTASTQGCPQA